MLIYLWWGIGMTLIFIPVLLSLFTIFLMLTNKAEEGYFINDGSWGQDVD